MTKKEDNGGLFFFALLCLVLGSAILYVVLRTN